MPLPGAFPDRRHAASSYPSPSIRRRRGGPAPTPTGVVSLLTAIQTGLSSRAMYISSDDDMGTIDGMIVDPEDAAERFFAEGGDSSWESHQRGDGLPPLAPSGRHRPTRQAPTMDSSAACSSHAAAERFFAENIGDSSWEGHQRGDGVAHSAAATVLVSTHYEEGSAAGPSDQHGVQMDGMTDGAMDSAMDSAMDGAMDSALDGAMDGAPGAHADEWTCWLAVVHSAAVSMRQSFHGWLTPQVQWPPQHVDVLHALQRKMVHEYLDRVDAMVREWPSLANQHADEITTDDVLACACRAAVVQLSTPECNLLNGIPEIREIDSLFYVHDVYPDPVEVGGSLQARTDWYHAHTLVTVQALVAAVLHLLRKLDPPRPETGRSPILDDDIELRPFISHWDFELDCITVEWHDVFKRRTLKERRQSHWLSVGGTFEVARHFARCFAEYAHALAPLPDITPSVLVDNPFKMYAALLSRSLPDPKPYCMTSDTYQIVAIGPNLCEQARSLWLVHHERLSKEQAAAAAAYTPAAAPPARERTIEELRKLHVRMALKVGSAESTVPTVSVQLWVPRRCVMCGSAISTSLMVNLRRRPQRQQTCDKPGCRLRHHDQQAVAQCEEQHGGDRGNFRELAGPRVCGMWAEKALPWSSSLSYYWDCRQCTKVPHPGHRPPLGCKWDPTAGAWVQKDGTTPAPALPPPPEKEQFIDDSRHFDKAGYLDAKKDWFELPGAKRPGEEYSETAYKRAFRRAKRDANDDNRKRKKRANYNVTVDDKRDREYSEWA